MFKKSKLILNSVSFFVCIALLGGMYGCGSLTQNQNASSILGSASPNQKNPEGNALYQKYQNEFPENLESITAEDYMEKWPNAGFIVQSADGSESVTVYTTGEAFKDVLDTVEESYPEFDEETFLNEQTKEIIEANKIGNSASSPDDVDMTEEEVKEELQERLQKKHLRISAEKRYMTFHEITKPEVQNQIAAQVSSIQQSILSDASQFSNITYGRRTVFTKRQTELLFYSFVIAWPFGTWRVPFQTIGATLGIGMTMDAYYGQDNKGNAYTHSFWAASVADACSGIPFLGPELGRWWGYEFTAARETNTEKDSRMDLHNDKVGPNVYYAHARTEWFFITIRVGLVRVRIPIWPYTATNMPQTAATLKVMSNNAFKVTDNNKGGWHQSPHDMQLIYLSD